MTSGELRVSVGINGLAQTLPLNGVITTGGTVDDGVRTTRTYGTGSGLIDLAAAATRAIGPSSSVTLDLHGGTEFQDISGPAAPFRAVKSLLIWVESGGDASGVRIGGAGSNPFVANFADSSDMALIYPDSDPYLASRAAGMPVTTTAKNLKIENLGAVSVTVSIYVIGSAAVSGTPIGLLLALTYP